MSNENQDQEKIRREIQEFMDRFRNELREFREFSHKDQIEASGLDNDPAYQALVEQGDVTINDQYKVNRLYPSLSEIEEEHKRRKQAQAQQEKMAAYEMKYSPNRVFIREFQEGQPSSNPQIQPSKKSLSRGLRVDTKMDKITKQDLERFVGEDLVSRIAILGFGITAIIAYQYLVNQGHVPIPVRMTVGFGLGMILFVISHFAQRKNVSIALIVSLLGVVISCFTIYLCRFSYHTIGEQFSIALLLFFVAVPAIQSVIYNRAVFAIAGLVGLSLAPLPLAYSGDHPFAHFLFYYFGVSLLFGIVAYLRGWRVLNVMTFGLYVILFLVWGLISDFETETDQIRLFSFSALYFALSFANLLLFNLKRENDYHIIDGYLLIINNIIFIISAGTAFDKLSPYGFGVFIAGVAVFNLFYIVLIYARRYADRPMIELMILFVSIALILTGFLETRGIYSNNWFAVLAVVLVWLGQYFHERLPRSLGIASIFLSLLILVSAWTKLYFFSTEVHNFLLNEAVWGSLLTFISILAIVFMLRDLSDEEKVLGMKLIFIRNILLTSLVVIVYCTGLFELLYHTPYIMGDWELRVLLIVAFNMVISVLLWFVVRKSKLERFEVITHWIMGAIVLSYILIGHWETVLLRDSFVEGRIDFYPFGFHYFIVAVSVLIGYIMVSDVVRSEAYKREGKNGYVLWFMSVMFFLHITAELEHSVILIDWALGNHDFVSVLEQVRLVGYSVVWSLLAFGFLLAGLYFKIKELRMVGLVFFLITFIKFIVFDFWSMGTPSKILSFLIISLAMFAVARAYKKLRIMIEEGDLKIFSSPKKDD